MPIGMPMRMLIGMPIGSLYGYISGSPIANRNADEDILLRMRMPKGMPIRMPAWISHCTSGCL